MADHQRERKALALRILKPRFRGTTGDLARHRVRCDGLLARGGFFAVGFYAAIVLGIVIGITLKELEMRMLTEKSERHLRTIATWPESRR